MISRLILFLCSKFKLINLMVGSFVDKYIQIKKLPVIENERQKMILKEKCRLSLSLVVSGQITPRIYKKGIE